MRLSQGLRNVEDPAQAIDFDDTASVALMRAAPRAVVEVAGDAVLADGNRRRALDAAALEHVRTARMEGAARRDRGQPRHRPGNLREAPGLLRQRRDRAHQTLRVGMQRRADHGAHRADLGDATGIHHRDAVGRLGDHAHVVGDQHHGRAVLAAEPLEQRDDLRLHRDVERGRRLVGDDQLGFGRQSASAITTRWRMPPENSCG